MYPSSQAPKLQLRLPNDLKKFIQDEAKRNGASQNSEVIRAVRERMDRKAAVDRLPASAG